MCVCVCVYIYNHSFISVEMEGTDKVIHCQRQIKFVNRPNYSNMMTQCTTSLWRLPEEVLIHILEKLHIRELLTLTFVSTHSFYMLNLVQLKVIH